MDGEPNVILLSADSLGAAAVEEGFDDLADAVGATTFRNAVAPASHTASAVPGLARGRFVDGSDASDDGRSERADPGTPPSLVERFRARGYETVLLTDNPLVAPAVGADDDRSAGGWRLLDGAVPRPVTRRVERAYFGRVWPWARRIGLVGPYYRPATALDRLARERVAGTDRPVFCWVHYMDTHHPYEPVPSAGATREEAATWRTAALSRRLAVDDPEAADPADLAAVRSLYDRVVGDLRAEIEAFVRALRREGAFDPDRDVLAVTADHGECLDPDRGMLGHVPPASWESLVHVPLLVARPDWPATSVDGQVSLVDLPRMLGVASDGRASGGDGPGRNGLGGNGDDAVAPEAFARRHAFTVAETLGTEGIVRGVRRDDGRKCFARRTAAGIDVVRTTFEVGDPASETVLSVAGVGGATESTDSDPLVRLLDRRGGAVDRTGSTRHDRSQLRALGYLE